MILSQIEQLQLIKQQNLKDFYTNDYLKNKADENLQLISELFFNNKIERAIKFNVWTWLFTTVTDVLTYFIWTPDLWIDINIEPYIKDLISVGQAVIWLKRVNWKLETYYIPWQDYIKYNWEHKVVSLYSNLENNEKVYYQLIQIFKPWYIENKLYKMINLFSNEWTIVPLDTIPQTSSLEENSYTWLDKPSIYIISVRDNLSWNQSELDKIKNIVYSLDRKAVMFETEFLKEIEQYKIFQNITFPLSAYNEDGTINLNKLWKVFASSDWSENADIKYISNINELIDTAISYEQTQIWKIATNTLIPRSFLWLEDSFWAISWTSRAILISPFVKKIKSYRTKIEEVLFELLEIFQTENREIETSIIWEDIIAKSDNELIEELRIARESWLISQYTWIKLYLGLKNEEDINKEIDRINLINNTNENG